MSIAVSLLQGTGLDQDIWFDPPTFEPTGKTAAMKQAFRIYSDLLKLTDPSSRSSCQVLNRQFAAGKCFVTLNWDFQFRIHNESVARPIKGKVGVAPLPGSTVVLDRQTDQLVPCTAVRCPYAIPLTTAPGAAFKAGNGSTTSTTISNDSVAATPLVNAPSFSSFYLDVGSWKQGLNAKDSR